MLLILDLVTSDVLWEFTGGEVEELRGGRGGSREREREGEGSRGRGK